MPQFLDLIESIPGSEAGTERLYRGEGRQASRYGDRPENRQAYNEARSLVMRVLEGSRYAALQFGEAMSTDDFPLLFGDILDRSLAQAFAEHPSDIERIARQRRVRDFREVATFSVDGAESQLGEVGERAPYPETDLQEARDRWRVNKYGRILDHSWETFVNDDLDAFRDAPMRLGRAARRTRARKHTELYVGASGPHADLYTAGNGNVVTGNPTLSVAGLEAAYTVLGEMQDTESEPIVIEGVFLVVPPALEVTARNILEGVHIDANESGGTSNQRLRAPNWLRGRLTAIVDPYIPLVASTANGQSSWYLFADPASGRAALEFGRLIGHETPEIWVKQPDAQRVGGGQVGFDQGDFEHDSIRYRVRDVHGGAQLLNTHGYKSTVASNGTG